MAAPDGQADRRSRALGLYEATEQSLPAWERDAEISWDVRPRLGYGTQPASLIPVGVWPTGDES